MFKVSQIQVTITGIVCVVSVSVTAKAADCLPAKNQLQTYPIISVINTTLLASALRAS